MLNLALDTGASHTILDLTEVLLTGYDLRDAEGAEEYETAGGNVITHTFRIKQFEALGEIRKEFIVSAYDYLQSGVLTDIDGVLGLDFFQGKKFCIDMVRREISF